MHAQPQRLSDPRRLLGEETLQRARAVEPDEVMLEHIREGDLRALGEGMAAGHYQHEPVLAEGICFQRAHIDRGSDDAEVGDPFGNEPDDLVAQPLLKIDADIGVLGEE